MSWPAFILGFLRLQHVLLPRYLLLKIQIAHDLHFHCNVWACISTKTQNYMLISCGFRINSKDSVLTSSQPWRGLFYICDAFPSIVFLFLFFLNACVYCPKHWMLSKLFLGILLPNELVFFVLICLFYLCVEVPVRLLNWFMNPYESKKIVVVNIVYFNF